MMNNGTGITKAYHNGTEITSIMLNGVDVGAFTPPVPDYQSWENYPDSPRLTTDYPYQLICMGYDTGFIYLYCSTSPIYKSGNYLGLSSGFQRFRKPWLAGEDFVWENVGGTNDASIIYEANNDVYTDSGLGTVYFAKTTA